jgi:DNA-binding GntR family transcriptional regulator
LREQGLHEHIAIADAIEAGDAELAEKLLREHVRNPEIYQVRKRGARVRATDVSWNTHQP